MFVCFDFRQIRLIKNSVKFSYDDEMLPILNIIHPYTVIDHCCRLICVQPKHETNKSDQLKTSTEFVHRIEIPILLAT